MSTLARQRARWRRRSLGAAFVEKMAVTAVAVTAVAAGANELGKSIDQGSEKLGEEVKKSADEKKADPPKLAEAPAPAPRPAPAPNAGTFAGNCGPTTGCQSQTRSGVLLPPPGKTLAESQGDQKARLDASVSTLEKARADVAQTEARIQQLESEAPNRWLSWDATIKQHEQWVANEKKLLADQKARVAAADDERIAATQAAKNGGAVPWGTPPPPAAGDRAPGDVSPVVQQDPQKAIWENAVSKVYVEAKVQVGPVSGSLKLDGNGLTWDGTMSSPSIPVAKVGPIALTYEMKAKPGELAGGFKLAAGPARGEVTVDNKGEVKANVKLLREIPIGFGIPGGMIGVSVGIADP